VVVDAGETTCVPFIAVLPVHGALHDVALLEVQVSVEEFPEVIVEGDAVKETVGEIRDGVQLSKSQAKG